MSLADKQCGPCHTGQPPISEARVRELLGQLSGWKITNDGTAIEKEWSFKNFAQSLDFINKIGEIAQGQGHHPDITFGWGYATIRLTTHASGGLQENDFIVAAKIDAL